MAEQKSAGAGRGFVNPQRVDESDATYVSPSDRYAMEKQRQEDRDMRQAEKSYNKYSAGGSISYKHDIHHVKKHAAGFAHHSEHYGKHSAGHMMEHEKVAKMCGGGMSKK
jgi:hypothetical protein